MKRAFVLFGAALLVALGLFLPRLTAAAQAQSLLGNVQQWENAAVSLTLAQEMVALPELDLFQSLELFSSSTTMVALEEGRCTSAQDAAQTASMLATMIPSDVYLDDPGNVVSAVQAVPYLLTDETGVSGIFWRCSWTEEADNVIWIEDQSGAPISFCLAVSHLGDAYGALAEDICQAVCREFFPAEIGISACWSEAASFIAVAQEENIAYLSVDYDGVCLYFNREGSDSTSIPMAAAGSNSAGNESILS